MRRSEKTGDTEKVWEKKDEKVNEQSFTPYDKIWKYLQKVSLP